MSDPSRFPAFPAPPPPPTSKPRGAIVSEAVLAMVQGAGGERPKGYSQLGTASNGPGDEEDEHEECEGGAGFGVDLLENENCRKVDIPTDAYGAAILAFSRDVPMLLDAPNRQEFELALWGCIYSLTVLVVNLILQFSILAYVYIYVVVSDIAKVQRRYQDFRLQVFDSDGEFLEDEWDRYDGKKGLCQIALWNRPFYYCVLFCWTLVMLIEIKKSEELLINLFEVPICLRPSEQLVSKDEDRYVVAFTSTTRNILIAIVAIPKLLISFSLLWLGCELLSATTQFENLVMNAVAMAFIVDIDEILFESILPNHHRADVENIDFLMKPDDDDEDAATKSKILAFKKSLLYILFTCIFIIVYAEYTQDVMPPDIVMIKDKCAQLIAEDTPQCSGWTWYLQGNPSAHDCFRYPDPSEVHHLQHDAAGHHEFSGAEPDA